MAPLNKTLGFGMGSGADTEIQAAVISIEMPAEGGVMTVGNDLGTQRSIVVHFMGLPGGDRQTRFEQPLFESVPRISSGLALTNSLGFSVGGPVQQVDTRSDQSSQKYFLDLVANTKAEEISVREPARIAR
eukprot:jgi/Undpi1/12936/HiC_scaffold_7.g02602.m1